MAVELLDPVDCMNIQLPGAGGGMLALDSELVTAGGRAASTHACTHVCGPRGPHGAQPAWPGADVGDAVGLGRVVTSAFPSHVFG